MRGKRGKIRTVKQLAERIAATPELTDQERKYLETMQPGMPLLCFGEKEIEIGKSIQSKIPEIKILELTEQDKLL